MLSKLPQPKPKEDMNHTLIGIIIILVLIVGVTGGYILFSQSQTPVVTYNTSNNTTANITANNTTSPVDTQLTTEKKVTNPNKSKKESD